MIQQPEDILKWLQENPPPEEIDYNEDGSEFIPIQIVENLLAIADPFWGTDEFRFRVFTIGERTFASSSVQLQLYIAGKYVRRVGASTVEINDGMNVESISLSESIKNAAKKYGNRMGKNLNGRNDAIMRDAVRPVKKNGKPPAVKMTPDKAIQEKYNAAFERNDDVMMGVLNQIYEIMYKPD